MSLEKPWVRPYQELLTALDAKWPAAAPKPRKTNDEVGVVVAMYTYRPFDGEFDGVRLHLDISEYPDPGLSFLEGEDNVEYLRLRLVRKLPYDIDIRRENMMDRVRKALRLDWEFQSGDEEFDREFFISARTDHGKRLLADGTFQGLVRDLSPFTSLGITPGGLFWSQEVRDESQLTIADIEPTLIRMHRMLEHLPSS